MYVTWHCLSRLFAACLSGRFIVVFAKPQFLSQLLRRICRQHLLPHLQKQLVCKKQVSAVMEFQSQQPCTATAVVRHGGTPCCAAGYADGCLRLFDLSTAALAWSAHHHSSGTPILAAHASPDGKQLLTIARFDSWPTDPLISFTQLLAHLSSLACKGKHNKHSMYVSLHDLICYSVSSWVIRVQMFSKKQWLICVIVQRYFIMPRTVAQECKSVIV